MFSETADRKNALEARGINPQTELPDSVTLSGDATSVRFHTSRKTGGYVKKEVDEYIVGVIAPSLEWFRSVLERRDQEVYKLGRDIEELDDMIVSLQREIESANMNNMILSSKRANEDDKEMATLMDQNIELRRQLDALMSSSSSSPEDYDELINAYKANEEAYQQQITEFSAYVAELEQQLESLKENSGEESNVTLQNALERCSLMEKDLEQFQVYVDQIQEYTTGLEEKIAVLEKELAEVNSNSNEASASLQNRLQQAEQETMEQSQRAEELLDEVKTYTQEIEKCNNEIATLKAKIDELESAETDNTASNEYEEAYTALVAHTEELTAHNAETVKQYQQRIEEVEAELNEAIERANEYYEHYIALQAEIDTAPSVENSEDSLIKARNLELSTQLDAIQAELDETQRNYAELYAAYEELTAAIPESGIVSMEEYTTLKVAYDEATTELASQSAKMTQLEKEVSSQKEGFVGEGITVENYKQIEAQVEELAYENKELTMKYETLLAKKESAGESDETSYSEEEYMIIYTHATEAIEEYNELRDVHEELRNAYEELRVSHEELKKAYDSSTTATASPAAKKKAGLPTKSKIVPTPKAAPASKYSEKKLPEGITLEDLQ